MKPLALVVPEKIPPSCDCGCRPHDYANPDGSRISWFYAVQEAEEKRFTDAELAAEVLMQERDHWRDMSRGGMRQDRYNRLLEIRDIASRPHYDEDTK